MLPHVRTLGVLMIVHGTLQALLSCCAPLGGLEDALDDPAFGVFMALFFSALLVHALVYAATGFFVLDYRFRVPALVVLGSGTIAACCTYCIPLAVLNGVLGYYVLTDPAVVEAFARRAEGATADEIRRGTS